MTTASLYPVSFGRNTNDLASSGAWTATGLASALVLAAPAWAQLPTPYDAPVRYDGIDKTSLYVASFDGVRLAVTVYRPTSGGKPAGEQLPVIVTQARGQMDSPQMTRAMRYFTDRGYIWVAQDRRGVGASFGRQTGFVNPRDAKDGKAVIEWAASRPYASGKAVTFGCSNQGVWQYRAAALAPKGLVAIAPACASPQFFDDAVVMNGIPIFPLRDAAFDGSCVPIEPGERRSGGNPISGTPVDEDKDRTLLKAAVVDQKCAAPMLGQFWRSIPRDGVNSFDNYRPAIADSAVSNADAIKRSGIGVLSLGGWYDAAGIGQMAAQAYWGGRVIMGPWSHGNRPPPGSSFPSAAFDLNPEMLRWYDHYAKGVQNGAEGPDVLYYTVNAPAGREWRRADRWPWSGDGKVRFYFGRDGLSSSAPMGKGAPISYAGRDVKWFGGKYAALNHWWGGDMAADDAESLSQTALPLSADMEVTGTPIARLWVAADVPDANIFAVLEDVGPDGRSSYVTDGQLRASWRKIDPSPWGVAGHVWHRGFASDIKPLKLGEPAPLTFEFYPTSYVFKAGHRVRISLITSMGLAYQLPDLAGGKMPTIKLYRDKAHPSAVDLPIIAGRRG